MKYVILFFILFTFNFGQLHAQFVDTSFLTTFEKSHGIKSATYNEAIGFYRHLANKYRTISIDTIGKCDGGYDLNVVYFSKAGKKNNNITILINNDIHAGEPDGVDACMMLIRNVASGKVKIPDNITLAIIPVYNIGGALNRNNTSRTNQNGPESYGFRANAQNLDLNRDFIKQDAKETAALQGLMRHLDPDIFIDNHVSDGADYQHIMTLLATQHNKLGGFCGDYIQNVFTPLLYKDMKQKGYDLIPYVNDFDNTPDKGWREFYDLPRFSSGYAALFQTLAYVPETHMLKPFKDRVMATYELMLSFIYCASTNAQEIKSVRAKDKNRIVTNKLYPLDWEVDTNVADSVLFSGYEAVYKPSQVSNMLRLFYDRNKPYTKNVPFYNHFIPNKTVIAPKAYIIPANWDNIINKLHVNDVYVDTLKKDTTISVTCYHIDNYETVSKPYESHYLHKNVKVTANTIIKKFRKGDYIVRLNQEVNRYIVETLEPTAPDAFFAWNFFDGILQQKEYFSDYVFEDRAAEILENNKELKKLLEAKRTDSLFANSAAMQLDFVYRNSEYMETGFLQYPVFRVE